MVWDYSSLANLEIAPWWNVGHVGSGSCIIPHWSSATPHWLARAPPLLPEMPQFLPSSDSAKALAQLKLLLVTSHAHPWLLLIASPAQP